MQLQLLKNAIHSLLPGAEQLINMQGTQKERRHAKGREKEREGDREGETSAVVRQMLKCSN